MRRLSRFARGSRQGQSILFAVTVCLLVAAAAVDPLLSRSFSYSLVQYHAHSEGLIGGQVQLRAAGRGLVPTSTLEDWLDPRVRAVTGTPDRIDIGPCVLG